MSVGRIMLINSLAGVCVIVLSLVLVEAGAIGQAPVSVGVEQMVPDSMFAGQLLLSPDPSSAISIKSPQILLTIWVGVDIDGINLC